MTLDTIDGLAAALQAQYNIPRAAAVRQARLTLGLPADSTPAEIARDEKILEKEEQREIVRLYRAYGCKVYSLSQARASKQTPSLADLWVTREARPLKRQDGRRWHAALAFWWESKRQVGGERTSGQIDFGNECIAAGVGYSFGDRYDAAKFLVTLGLAVEDKDGEYGIRPALIG